MRILTESARRYWVMPKDPEYHLTTDCGSSPCGKRHKFGVLEESLRNPNTLIRYLLFQNPSMWNSTERSLNILKYFLLWLQKHGELYQCTVDPWMDPRLLEVWLPCDDVTSFWSKIRTNFLCLSVVATSKVCCQLTDSLQGSCIQKNWQHPSCQVGWKIPECVLALQTIGACYYQLLKHTAYFRTHLELHILNFQTCNQNIFNFPCNVCNLLMY